MKPLVIGVGNRWRRDDAVGPRVIDALARSGGAELDLDVHDGEPARLVAAWEGRSVVVVVDAIRAGSEPGAVHRIDALRSELPTQPSTSSHAAGVAVAVALARSLDRLPRRLVVLGVEPESLDHGSDLSPAVAAALDEISRRALEEATNPCA